MQDAVDVAVIGGGVVGAAVLRRLAARGLSAFLLEKHARTGGETTERNSGVIHAGLYYPAESLKTQLCVAGNPAIYSWAEKHGVPHRRCGKLIVAKNEAEEAALHRLVSHGRSVGVPELMLLSGREARALEPSIEATVAVLSGSTGVVDPVELTRSLIDAAVALGAEVIVGAEVRAIDGGPPWTLDTARGPITAQAVVNAAGLHADEVAKLAGIDRYRIHPCRGDYFLLKRRPAPSRLIYPVKVPGAPGLGIHLTIDVANRVRLGPDAEYVASKSDYRPAPEKAERFLEAARKLMPEIAAEDLEYDSAGIRPKLRGPNDPAEKDFVIAQDRPGFIDLIGIESPGLTSALAIAEMVERFF